MNINSLRSLQQRQNFLRILIFSFATVMVWVGFSLFLSQKQTGISPELQKLAISLNPNIHLEVVEQLQQKRSFSEADLASFPILRIVHNSNGTDTVSTTNATAVTPTPVATPSPNP